MNLKYFKKLFMKAFSNPDKFIYATKYVCSKFIGNFLLSIFRLSEYIITFFGFFLFLTHHSKFEKNSIFLCRFYSYSSGDKDEQSTEKLNLDDTLYEYFGEQLILNHYFWDKDQLFLGNYLLFIFKLIKSKAQFCLISSYSDKRYGTTPLFFLKIIKKILGVKFIFFWWDTCSISFKDSNNHLLKFADLNVVNDNPNGDFFKCKKLIMDKTIFLWTPLPSTFYKNISKEIDLVFLGQISSYRNYRSKYIFEIMKNNIPGIFSLFDREFQPKYLEYSMLIAKSRIGLNFSYSVDGHQLKGRIFETILSGTLLLESKNHQITNLFTEGEDYVAFEDEYDLIKKIKFFLKNEKEREKITNSGQKKILQKYSSYNYWYQVFSRIEELEKKNKI